MSQKEKMLWIIIKSFLKALDTSTFLLLLFHIEQSLLSKKISVDDVEKLSEDLIQCYFETKE